MMRNVVIALMLGGMALPALAQTSRPATTISQRQARALQFYRQITVGDYPRVGRHDPKWDADATAVLEALARMLALDFRPDGDEYDDILASASALREHRCNDPLVIFAMARTYQYLGRKAEDYQPIYVESANRIVETGYHPLIKGIVGLEGAAIRARDLSDRTASRRDGRRIVAGVIETLPLMLRDPQVTADQVLELYDELGDASRFVERDRTILVEQNLSLLEHSDRFKLIAPVIRAQYLLAYTREAQRSTTMPADQAQKLFTERLATATAAGELAWKADPTSAPACEIMIHICNARPETRASARQWLDRGRSIDPDDYSLYAAYLGSIEGVAPMIEFGRECLAQGNWDAGIPMLLVEAHLRAAALDANGQSREIQPDYFKSNPRIWQDIQAVYEPFLRRNPDSLYHRSRYAQLACWAGHSQPARQQFAAMGQSISLSWFKSRQNYETCRAQAVPR